MSLATLGFTISDRENDICHRLIQAIVLALPPRQLLIFMLWKTWDVSPQLDVFSPHSPPVNIITTKTCLISDLSNIRSLIQALETTVTALKSPQSFTYSETVSWKWLWKPCSEGLSSIPTLSFPQAFSPRHLVSQALQMPIGQCLWPPLAEL